MSQIARLAAAAGLALVGLLPAACTSSRPPLQSHPIESAIVESPFDRAFWSILVEEETGEVVYALNADKLTIPASNRKLFSAAAIATCVGLDTQLTTSIWIEGDDLVIRGGGDPALGSARYERSGEFFDLADRLRARGLSSVRDVIADVALFDRTIIPGGWKHGNLGAGYAAPVDAIAWTENQSSDGRAVAEPGLHAASALRDALEARGIRITGQLRLNTEPRVWTNRVDVIASPLVFDLLSTVLKNSHNLYTEMLLKRLAAGTAPATYASALEREAVFLAADAGLLPGTFRFVDGSGLAPDNLVTPATTIRMLRWMNEPARRGIWWGLLPQPGGEGTLRRRILPLGDRLRAKTGTVAGVNALSGIIAMPGGSFRYFSIAVNHHIGDGSDALRIIDAIVEQIAAPGAL